MPNYSDFDLDLQNETVGKYAYLETVDKMSGVPECGGGGSGQYPGKPGTVDVTCAMVGIKIYSLIKLTKC